MVVTFDFDAIRLFVVVRKTLVPGRNIGPSRQLCDAYQDHASVLFDLYSCLESIPLVAHSSP